MTIVEWVRRSAKALGREPAHLAGVAAAAVQLLSVWRLDLTVEQQGALNAAVVALLGVLSAWAVSAEKAVPLLTGFGQAVMACALAFGAHLDPALQASIMAFVSALAGWHVRTQVLARGTPAYGRHSAPVKAAPVPLRQGRRIGKFAGDVTPVAK